MTSEVIAEDLKVIVENFMQKKGVTRYELEIEGQSETGDNYLGEIIFFKIVTENKKKTYNYVMKTAKRSEALRQSFPVEMVYKRELFMYSDVFPSYREFLREVKPEFKLDFVPKVYWIDATENQETLIFENLKCVGFKLWDRKKPWNLEHSLFVMENYGKLHGLSLALRDQKPEVFRKLTENMKDLWVEMAKSMDLGKCYQAQVKAVMNVFQQAGRDDLVQKFEGLDAEAESLFKSDTREEDKLLINHGDCWNNNFMFQYENEGTSRPSRMCFLDFQLSAVDTPVRDLSYNIYTTCDKSCLDNFDLLLETYHASLSNTLKSLGSDPEKLFPYEKLRQHWKNYGKIGLLLANEIIKLQLINKDDAPNFVELAESGFKIEDGINIEVKDDKEYERRIIDVYGHFADTFL